MKKILYISLMLLSVQALSSDKEPTLKGLAQLFSRVCQAEETVKASSSKELKDYQKQCHDEHKLTNSTKGQPFLGETYDAYEKYLQCLNEKISPTPIQEGA